VFVEVNRRVIKNPVVFYQSFGDWTHLAFGQFYIRLDSATVVNRTAFAGFERIVARCIGAGRFALFIAVCIIQSLDASARWRVITRNGDFKLGSVSQVDRTLDESFPETAAAHNHR